MAAKTAQSPGNPTGESTPAATPLPDEEPSGARARRTSARKATSAAPTPEAPEPTAKPTRSRRSSAVTAAPAEPVEVTESAVPEAVEPPVPAKRASRAKPVASAPAEEAPAAPRTRGKAKPAPEPVAEAPSSVGGPRRPVVREGEDPWSDEELAEIRAELLESVVDLRAEIDAAELAWAEQLRDSGEGAGDDQADAGTKTFEREHELSLASNTRELLAQVERALQRLDSGTYGACENCGNPIGKARLQAFPRATLCVTCKQREERR